MNLQGSSNNSGREKQTSSSGRRDSVESKLKRLDMLRAEANSVREKDKIIIRSLFKNFYHKKLTVGIGFQRAYGSILAGDYFDLIKLPDASYMFVFADVSGHGLPAYTTLIRLRSAISLAVKEMNQLYAESGRLDTAFLVQDINSKFTDIMEDSNSSDFACVNFTIIAQENNEFVLRFYNRSMLFPIVVRSRKGSLPRVLNLNNSHEGWKPEKSFLLSTDLRGLMKQEYDMTPECRFTLSEGDSVLFYSDGITEACDAEGIEFGDSGVEDVLKENAGLFPQVIVDDLFRSVYDYIGAHERQKDDMTAVMINFPLPG